MKLPARCVDLTPTHVVLALGSMSAMRHLLEHLARIARPGEGAPKILVPIARMASTDCDWIDGGLTVEITGAADMTQILVAIDLGAGVRELIFPRFVLGVHHDEFLRAIKVAPRLVFPMTSRVKKQGLILTCSGDVVGSLAPPSFEVAEENVRRSLPAKLRRSLAPLPQRRDTDVDAMSPKLDTANSIGEVAVLARIVPRAPKTPALDELAALDVGWDVGSYSSALNTRETKPPPEARPLSTSPTRPPQEPPRNSKAPPRNSKAPPRTSKAPPRSSKAPPRSSKAPPRPPAPRPPVVRRSPSPAASVDDKRKARSKPQ